MPAMQMMVGRLNKLFSEPEIRNLAQRRDVFAAGGRLSDVARTLRTAPEEIREQWIHFLDSMPRGIEEALRSVMFYALSTSPPTEITFAWAPAYDFELGIWHAPDTAKTKGGITILIRTRYPDDRHPLAQ
jgi:hypothetical protein